MIVLEGQEFESDEGLWVVEYIGEPNAPAGSDRIDYHLRFKWVDPEKRDNKVTPERRLRLTVYKSQSAARDCETKLRGAILSWLNSTVECVAVFDYKSATLRDPDH